MAAALTAVVISGCVGEKRPPEGTTARAMETEKSSGEEDGGMTAAVTPDVSAYAGQLALISSLCETWTAEETDGEHYVCAVTDLNRNGRLEIIDSSNQGTGLYTYSQYYEVNENGDGLVHLRKTTPEGDSEADISSFDQAPVYYDEGTGRYSCIFEDVVRNGAAEHYYNVRALWLEDGKVMEELLARKSVIWEDENHQIVTCEDALGKPITEKDYDEAAANRFSGQKAMTLKLRWVSADDLLNSYAPELSMGDLSEKNRDLLLENSLHGFSMEEGKN